MQYIIQSKNGLSVFTGIFTIIKSESPDNTALVIDFSIESLRKRMSKIMKKELKKIRPNGNYLSWKTKLGVFCIYKDFEYDNNWNIYGCKFRSLFLYVELDKRNYGGEVETKKYFIKKEPNPDCEDYEECVCGEGLKAMYNVKIKNKNEMRCIKCKKFLSLIDRIGKKLDNKKAKNQ